TPTFFYGMSVGEEIKVDIEEGKTLVIKLVSLGTPNLDGTRNLSFELNGLVREVVVRDISLQTAVVTRVKADKNDPGQIGAPMSGTVLKVLVEKGQRVKRGDVLLVTEAMKMETTIQAPFDGYVKEVYVKAKDPNQTGDLLMEVAKQLPK
ncbi:MAG: pycA, partial [Firmicutes bacterium]|nr:pycA [Bacillota bacterium]